MPMETGQRTHRSKRPPSTDRYHRVTQVAAAAAEDLRLERLIPSNREHHYYSFLPFIKGSVQGNHT